MKVPVQIGFANYTSDYELISMDWVDNVRNLTSEQIKYFDGIPSNDGKEVDIYLTIDMDEFLADFYNNSTISKIEINE
jgi:hypothetical protein